MENYDTCQAFWKYESGLHVKVIRYLLKGITHRIDGPAEIYCHKSGKVWQEFYCINGKLHRENGPAFIRYYKSGQIKEIRYYIENVRHKIDGPAMVTYGRHGGIRLEYYVLNGILLNDLRKYVNQIRKASNKTEKLLAIIKNTSKPSILILNEMFKNEIDSNVISNLEMFL